MTAAHLGSLSFRLGADHGPGVTCGSPAFSVFRVSDGMAFGPRRRYRAVLLLGHWTSRRVALAAAGEEPFECAFQLPHPLSQTPEQSVLFQASSKVFVSLDMLPVGWLELGSMLQDLQGVLSVLAPSVLAGPECTDRQRVMRERKGRVADREGEELVKGWPVAAWMVLVASFNPGIFQGTREVVGIADHRLRLVWLRVAQDIAFSRQRYTAGGR